MAQAFCRLMFALCNEADRLVTANSTLVFGVGINADHGDATLK